MKEVNLTNEYHPNLKFWLIHSFSSQNCLTFLVMYGLENNEGEGVKEIW